MPGHGLVVARSHRQLGDQFPLLRVIDRHSLRIDVADCHPTVVWVVCERPDAGLLRKLPAIDLPTGRQVETHDDARLADEQVAAVVAEGRAADPRRRLR